MFSDVIGSPGISWHILSSSCSGRMSAMRLVKKTLSSAGGVTTASRARFSAPLAATRPCTTATMCTPTRTRSAWACVATAAPSNPNRSPATTTSRFGMRLRSPLPPEAPLNMRVRTPARLAAKSPGASRLRTRWSMAFIS